MSRESQTIRLERNIITRNLFEAVVISDQAKGVLINNTLVKNGGGAAFLGSSTIEASGNIVSLNKVGFLIAASSQTKTSYNALFNSDGNYMRAGSPNVPAPELQAESDMTTDPRFVDAEHDDFRLKARHDPAQSRDLSLPWRTSSASTPCTQSPISIVETMR